MSRPFNLPVDEYADTFEVASDAVAKILYAEGGPDVFTDQVGDVLAAEVRQIVQTVFDIVGLSVELPDGGS